MSYAATNVLEIEGVDVPKSYLFGELDMPVYIEQPSNSSGKKERSGKICKLQRSIYGLREAGSIRGSMLHIALDKCVFIIC